MATTAPAANISPAWRFAFVLLAGGTVGVAFAVLSPILALLARQFGGEAVAQRIVVAPLLGFAVGGLTAGWITAMAGVRRTILVGAAVFVLAGSSGLFVQTAPVLLVGAFLVGFSAVTLATAGGVVMAEHWEGDARSRVIGFQNAFGNLMSASCAFVSGALAEAAGWRAPFLLFVVAGVATFVAAGFGVGVVAAARPERSGGFRAYLPLAPAFTAVALVLLVVTTTFTHMSLLMAALGVASTTATAAVISVQAVAGMTAALLYGPLVARIGRLTASAIGVVLGAAGFICSGLFPSVAVFAASCVGIGAAAGLIVPFIVEEVLRLAGPAIRAQALGYFATVQFAGGFLNPFVLAPITAALGLRGMYVTVGIATAVLGLGGVAALAARRRSLA